MPSAVTLFLAGDVMTGRGVDQILPHPGDPRLREPLVKDARDYVTLAERTNGPIPRPVGFDHPWGVALSVLDDAEPDARIVNLETSVTTSPNHAPGKGIHYRMHPRNVGVLSIARIDVCALANNHVLDFGRTGLVETLDVLESAGMETAGAGRDDLRAWAPATVPIGSGRVLVWSMGSASSGISRRSRAGPGRSGVALLPDLSDATATRVLDRIGTVRGPADLVVVSIHWGSNWGYDVPGDQIRFAHRLVDGGVDVVHGHSSHHPRPVEIHHGHPVLYGCGDLINDYEGIGGYEGFRDELRLLYLPVFAADTKELRELRMVPVRARRMRLEHATREEAAWLRSALGVGDSSRDVVWIAP